MNLPIPIPSIPMEPAEIRQKILEFEQKLSALPGAGFGDQESCPLKHSFVNGIYTREIFIPAGMWIVGKIHRHSHPNFLMQGMVTVVTEEGVKRIAAPCAMVSPAGTKRLLFTHTDTVWITVHRTDATTPEQAEEEIIAKSYAELEGAKEVPSLPSNKEEICHS